MSYLGELEEEDFYRDAFPAKRKFRDDPRDIELFNQHEKYVGRIVRKIASHLPSNFDSEDLYNVGAIGLMDAITKYDPSRDNKFLTYAKFRIKGEVLSELRKKDFLGAPARKSVRKYERTFCELEKKLERKPEEKEIAERMEISTEKLREIKSDCSMVFLDSENLREPYDILPEFSEQENILEQIIKRESSQILNSAIRKLPVKERVVFSLHYKNGLTLKKIAEIIEHAECTASEMHLRAKKRLRVLLKDYDFG